MPDTLASLDGMARRAVIRRCGRREDTAARVLGVVTSRWLMLPLALGAWAFGRRPRVTAAGREVAAAMAVEAMAATALKLAAGRARPDDGGDPGRWHRPGGRSMPSGHTANVAAASTALAAATGSDMVLAAGLTLAAVTGFSRVVCDRHWASDTVAGLVLGYLSAKAAGALVRSSPQARASAALTPPPAAGPP